MSKYPYLPLFTDAYFGDTKHLTCEEHGAYLQLIMIAWRSPGCRIPADDAKIARMIGLSMKRWLRMKPTIMAFWTETENGEFEQTRLTKERIFVASRIEKRVAAGRLGGRPKSLKNNEEAKAKGSENEKQNESKTKALTLTPNLEEERECSETTSLHTHRVRENPKKPARGSVVDPAFWPNDKGLAIAAEEGIHGPALKREVEHFVDHHTQKGTLGKDWQAGWRTWCRSPYRKPGGNGVARGKPPSNAELFGEIFFDTFKGNEDDGSDDKGPFDDANGFGSHGGERRTGRPRAAVLEFPRAFTGTPAEAGDQGIRGADTERAGGFGAPARRVVGRHD